MHQTPPTVPLPDPSAQRRPRTSFYAAVGCLSVIAGLLLGVGGFFGVRALQYEGGAPISGGESTGPAPEPTVLEKAPVGPDSAVPLGSTFPIESTLLEGQVDVTPTTVDWDATAEIHEANAYNEKPEAGSKYILLTVEGVYHGDGFEEWRAGSWLDVVYVAEDGTRYDRAFRVTPRHEELIGQKGVGEDGGFLSEYCFEVPGDLEAGGHFGLYAYVMDIDSGSSVEASCGRRRRRAPTAARGRSSRWTPGPGLRHHLSETLSIRQLRDGTCPRRRDRERSLMSSYSEHVTRVLTEDREHPGLGTVTVLTFAPLEGEEHRPATLGPRSVQAVTGALGAALDRAEAGEIRAIALTGTGRVFLAGADLSMFAD